MQPFGTEHLLIPRLQVATATFGPVPVHVPASMSLPPSRNSTKQELHGSGGQSVTYQGRVPAGVQQAPIVANYITNFRQSLPPVMHHDVPHIVLAGDRQFHAQVAHSYPGARGPFPYYSAEPVQQMSRQPPTIGSSPVYLKTDYSQCTPSSEHGPQVPQISQSEGHNYQGYYFGTLSLPRVRHKAQSEDQQPMQPFVHPDSSRVPFANTGNDRAQGRLQGQAVPGDNPRKSFSDDARLMRHQQCLDRQEYPNNNGQARRTSSAAYYDLNRPQTGVQQTFRGHRRNSNGRGSSRRRSSVSQHTPPGHGQQPLEGRPSNVGSFGGGRGSGEYTSRKLYETIDEDRAERGFRDLSSREAMRGKEGSDSHISPHKTKRRMRTEMTWIPDHVQESMAMPTYGEAIGPSSHATNQSDLQNHSTSCRPTLLDPPPFSTNSTVSVTDVNVGGPSRPSWATRPDIDPQKLYVKGQWLQPADIASFFEPYGTVLHIGGSLKPNYPGIQIGRTCYFVRYAYH